MNISLKKLSRKNAVWLLVGGAFLALYLYLCFAYNLQFYTEDERYVQLDMTYLPALNQWKMSNYRISASLGCFLYYPLQAFLEIVSSSVSSLSGGEFRLLIVPMMLSKLTHTILVVLGWLWFVYEVGRLLFEKWGVTRWGALLCMLFTAMLPVNIFLAKTNNYDSLYNILCLIGGIYYYRYILKKNSKDIVLCFFLLSLAMQEKFAAYPFYSALLILFPFFMEPNRKGKNLKELAVIVFAITAGSLFPSMLRILAELIWAQEISIVSQHWTQFHPFHSYSKALNIIKRFAGLEVAFSNFFIKWAFVLNMLGFGVWAASILAVRRKITVAGIAKWKTAGLILAGILQVLFLLWAFAPVFYDVPPSGKYPLDTPPPGTYLPPHLSDSHPTFYYGAGHLEYTFIKLMKSVGFFKTSLYSLMLVLLFVGPILLFVRIRGQDGHAKSLAALSVIIFDFTMLLVVLVNFSSVPFGGRYANIYLTLLGVSAFFSLVAIGVRLLRIKHVQDYQMLPMAVVLLTLICMAEVLPYGPSYQVFGNWFYPKSGCGGWGEPTSALVQAARNNPFLKQCLGMTYTTYTGLAIEKPFLTPLINLRLIRSRSVENKGKLRTIQYLLAEQTALGQNPWLKKVLERAKTIDGAVVWEWTCRGETSAWLIDLHKIGLYDFQEKIDPDKIERHYRGEWFF